jgi:Protein of unknown function (DUF3499)
MISGPNWARRYGSHHRRLCARPGCGAVAAATLRFQPTQREAWLVELDDSSPRTEGDLCARHAAALVLPRGWELHDERIERPEVLEEVPARPKRPRAPRTQRPGLRALPEPQPQLELEVVVDVEASHDDELLAAADPSPAPIADLDDVFDVQTPLLRRAFENVKPLDDDEND